jgi:hypothetical protein
MRFIELASQYTGASRSVIVFAKTSWVSTAFGRFDLI